MQRGLGAISVDTAIGQCPDSVDHCGLVGDLGHLVHAAPGALRIADGPEWTLAPQVLQLSETAVPVNAANCGPGLAPGSLIVLTGSGFTMRGSEATAEVGGETARVVQASAFRLNVALPADLATGPQIGAIQNGQDRMEVPGVKNRGAGGL